MDMLNEKMVKQKLLEKKYISIMRNFYIIAKKIGHREIKIISGKQYDKYYDEARDFVNRMKN